MVVSVSLYRGLVSQERRGAAVLAQMGLVAGLVQMLGSVDESDAATVRLVLDNIYSSSTAGGAHPIVAVGTAATRPSCAGPLSCATDEPSRGLLSNAELSPLPTGPCAVPCGARAAPRRSLRMCDCGPTQRTCSICSS